MEVENSVYREKLDDATQSLQKGKLSLIKSLRALAAASRHETKARLHANSFRLGRVTMLPNGTRFQEFWEDGVELQRIKEQIEITGKEKERLDKLRR
jgi:hypothetical protein